MKKVEKKPKKAVSEPPSKSEVEVTEEQIRTRAHEIFLERGGEPGHELEDWLRAEQELRQRS